MAGSFCNVGAFAFVSKPIVLVASEAVALSIAGLAQVVGSLANATVVEIKSSVASFAGVGVVIEVTALYLHWFAYT